MQLARIAETRQLALAVRHEKAFGRSLYPGPHTRRGPRNCGARVARRLVQAMGTLTVDDEKSCSLARRPF